MSKLITYIIALIPMMLTSCVKEESPFTIPYAPVRFEIDINGVDSDLYPGSYKTFIRPRSNNEYVGYGGLLIYRNYDGRVFAYDLCCPYEDDKNIIVTSKDNVTAQCDMCGSSFDIISGLGFKQSGPSSEGLQRYRVESKGLPEVFYIKNL